MSECKYCSLLPNGDIPSDTKDILDKTFLHRFYSVRIGNNGNDFGIIIEDRSNHQIVLSESLNFRFCPMCGKSIWDKDRVEK